MNRPKNNRSVHEEDTAGRIFDHSIYSRFAPFAKPYLGYVLGSVVLLVFLSLTTMTMPLVMRWAIDHTFGGGARGPEASSLLGAFSDLLANITGIQNGSIPDEATRIHGLGVLASIGGVVGLLTFALRYTQIHVANWTGQHIIFDLRNHVFRHLQGRNLRFFDTRPVGKLVTRVTSDIEALAELFTSGIDVLFYDLVMIGVTLTVLFAINTKLALLSLALVPFVSAWSFYFKREAQQLFRHVRARVTRLNSFINESITGIRVIQIFRTEAKTRDRFTAWNRDLKDAHVKTVKNFSLFFPGIGIFSALGAGMVLLVGHQLVGEGRLSIGDMFAFWILLQRFFEPLKQLSEKYNVLQSAMASGERLAEILDTEESIPTPTDAHPVAKMGPLGNIEFDNVHFSYDGKTEVLHGISFVVQRGEKLAIVGATGAGKSSLINVLGRFYEISSGSVRLDGVDIREMDKHELRRSVGIVLQEVFLFADTVRENLRLGDESITDAMLNDALQRVYAADFVNGLEGGLDHEVEERGATFSLGEKQLLSFARTLVHNPPILVLDEATANIDTETEHLIQMALERLMESRTVIVIAHRLSTIKKADRIIVMHHGEIREQGTHRELLAKQEGLYRRLYELQYRGQDKLEATLQVEDD